MEKYEEGKEYTGSRGGRFVVRKISRGSNKGELTKVYLGGAKRDRSSRSSHRPSSSKKLSATQKKLVDEWPQGSLFNQSLGDYILSRELGEGVYGVVHTAIRKKDGKIVAIKRMRFTHNVHLIEPQVMAEIHFNRYLQNNPHVIKILGAGLINRDKDTDSLWYDFFMVYPLMHGEFHTLLGWKQRPAGLFQSLFLQYLDGVEALHDAGFVHRDLHNHNLLYYRDHEGKFVGVVGDLGLACHAHLKHLNCGDTFADYDGEDHKTLIKQDVQRLARTYLMYKVPKLSEAQRKTMYKCADIRSLREFIFSLSRK